MKIHFLWVILIAAATGLGGGWAGFKMTESKSGKTKPESEKSAGIQEPVKLAKAEDKKVEAAPTLTDEDIENLIAEVEEDEPGMDEDEAKRWGERSKRWANFNPEQRRVWRKAFFSALADVDGLEEVEDAVKSGKLDAKTFEIKNVEDIADRMEFYTETMDETAINQEMTRTLEGIVSKANSQLKGGGGN